jgi:DJ-1 family protein
MKRTAVIFADGCEEGEALTIVDIFRRAALSCDMVGLHSLEVTGGHQIIMKMDAVMDESLVDYDLVILPGGYEGAVNMRDSKELIEMLQKMYRAGRVIGAICAAPIVLDKAGLLINHQYTCYPSTSQKITTGKFLHQIIVEDENLITSQGPATAYAFAYYLVAKMGGDALKVQERMVYFNAFHEEAEHE